jgi:hypothetical protein
VYHLPGPDETLIGERLHVIGFGARQYQPGHPLSDQGRKLEAVSADRKVLPSLVFLMLWWLIRYSNMEKNEPPALLFCYELQYDTLSEHS